jgi:hypothetical protein
MLRSCHDGGAVKRRGTFEGRTGSGWYGSLIIEIPDRSEPGCTGAADSVPLCRDASFARLSTRMMSPDARHRMSRDATRTRFLSGSVNLKRTLIRWA